MASHTSLLNKSLEFKDSVNENASANNSNLLKRKYNILVSGLQTPSWSSAMAPTSNHTNFDKKFIGPERPPNEQLKAIANGNGYCDQENVASSSNNGIPKPKDTNGPASQLYTDLKKASDKKFMGPERPPNGQIKTISIVNGHCNEEKSAPVINDGIPKPKVTIGPVHQLGLEWKKVIMTY